MTYDLRIVTMEELKVQMRVDFDEENDLIKSYGVAAEDVVIDMTRRSLEELTNMDERGFPPQLKVAILMIAAHFYRNREPVASVAQNVVPYSIGILVKPYVKLSNREDVIC